MKKILAASILALAALTTLTTPAYADNVGNWTKVDVKVPIHKFDEDTSLRLRVTPEFAFTDDAGGLKQTVFRAGPQLKVNKWFNFTLNGVSSTVNAKQDLRPEVQPEFTVKEGLLKVNDRNRLSYRALDNAKDDRWQYANELKAAVDLPGTQYNVFGSHEWFLDFQKEKMIQHRLTAGMGRYLNDNWLMEAGYLYRTSLTAPEWTKDHMLFLCFSNK